MGRVGKKRKRYILFRQVSAPSSTAREEFGRLLSKRYPTLTKNAIVWIPNGLIIRSDNVAFKEMRVELPELHVGDFRLEALSTSGSISKLKRLAEGKGGQP